MVLIDPADYDGPVRCLVCRVCGSVSVDPDQDRDADTAAMWCDCVGGMTVADVRLSPVFGGADE